MTDFNEISNLSLLTSNNLIQDTPCPDLPCPATPLPCPAILDEQQEKQSPKSSPQSKTNSNTQNEQEELSQNNQKELNLKETTNQGEKPKTTPKTPVQEKEMPEEFETPMKWPPGPWSNN